MTVYDVIYYLILCSGIAIGLYKSRRLLLPARLLWLLLVFITVKELVALYYSHTHGSNLRFYQYLSPADFLWTAGVFFTLPLMSRHRSLIISLSLLVFLFYLANLLFLEIPGKGADANFKLVRSSVLVLFSLLLFRRLIDTVSNRPLYKKSEFWIAVGIIFFYLFNIFYWGCYNFLLKHPNKPFQSLLRQLFIYTNYLLYLSYGIAVYLNHLDVVSNKISHSHDRR